MGFIKNMINSITGNWADINLKIGEGTKGADIPLKVFIQNKSGVININKRQIDMKGRNPDSGWGESRIS